MRPVHAEDVDGVVPLVGRGSLPFEMLHGLPLYRHALLALSRVVAEPALLVEPGDHGTVAAACADLGERVRVVVEDDWRNRVHEGAQRSMLVHDPLCPLVPDQLLTDFCVRGLAQPGTSYVAFRPVTDTVKTSVGGRIEGTVDREGLVALTSPVLVAEPLVAGLPTAALRDPQRLLQHLRAHGATELLGAPSIARRVDDISAVHLLECLDELERRLRHAASDARAPRTP